MRYYTYDTDFKYTGFIDTTVQPENSTIIEPTDETYNMFDSVNNEWYQYIAPAPTLDELKADKIKLAREYFDEIIKSYEQDSADFEPDTWDTQRQEWLEYIKDANNITPYCDMLASARGITRDDLMTKIGDKVLGFAQVQGTLQSIEDSINLSSTEDELNAIVW